MEVLFYEDFAPGWTGTFGPLKITEGDIIGYASVYDPQPFHTDPKKAQHTFPGRLIASGWHSCALLSKLLVQNILLKIAGQGSPGIEETRWVAPLFPGDEISLRTTVTETRLLQSKPDIGILKFELELFKQDGTISTTMRA